MLKVYQERFNNQEEIIKVQAEKLNVYDARMKEKERFIDEGNWKLNEL
jgi:hypothetical protein